MPPPRPAPSRRRRAIPALARRHDRLAIAGAVAVELYIVSEEARHPRREHGVGHYGVFSGRTWQQQIYPMVKNVILQSD
ncbi:MAG: hypothetical protein HY244_08220 [Rhizobiales bacterium]|nr:hypothetical protein [Hyphomicrobiales bacterium]